jgi:hypothetical protein
LASRDGRQLAERHAFLDVDPAELACDRRVLLRDVLDVPRFDDCGFGPVTGIELDPRGPQVALGEAPERLVGGPLEREDVRCEISAHDQARRPDLGEQALGAGGGVLVVVQEDVVEERLARAGGDGGLLDQAGEVHLARRVEHRKVVTQEHGELAPSAQPGRSRAAFDVLGRDERLLGSDQELTHLVSEPPQREQRSVGGPHPRIFAGEELADARELLVRREHLGRGRVAEGRETLT